MEEFMKNSFFVKKNWFFLFGERWCAILVYVVVSSSALANVVGVDTQNFNPITDGLDYVTVHSSKTLEPGILNLGFFLNYAVNSLPNYEALFNQSRSDIVDTLFSSDFNVGLGLTSWWDAGLSIPQMHSQTIDSDAYRGQFESSGITEFRFNTKVRVWGDSQTGGLALVGSMNLNRLENNPFSGENPGPTFNLETVWDQSRADWSYSLNLGYRFRNPGDPIVGVPVQPFRNQYLASVGVSYLKSDWDTKFIGEVFSSFPAEKVDFTSDRQLSSAELLLGVKIDVTHHLAFHAGGGTEIIHGTGSPDWRVYSGINWTFEPWLTGGDRDSLIVRRKEWQEGSVTNEDPFSHDPDAPQETFVASGVLFAFNSDQPSDDLLRTLKPMVEYLKKPPGIKFLQVVGHTDSVGSSEYNLNLSQRRAETVRKALLKMGLPGNKIKAIGKGESEPIAPNTNYQGRARNRRVEFKVYR